MWDERREEVLSINLYILGLHFLPLMHLLVSGQLTDNIRVLLAGGDCINNGGCFVICMIPLLGVLSSHQYLLQVLCKK